MARYSPRIERKEYDSFVRAIPNDERLPASYDAWIKRTLEQDAKHIANGDLIKELVVNYQEFAEYCRATGQQPSYDLLLACVVMKAAKS